MNVRTVVTPCAVFVLCASPLEARSHDSDDGGFTTPHSVEDALAATAERQRKGDLQGYLVRKERPANNTGLPFHFDDDVLLPDNKQTFNSGCRAELFG